MSLGPHLTSLNVPASRVEKRGSWRGRRRPRAPGTNARPRCRLAFGARLASPAVTVSACLSVLLSLSFYTRPYSLPSLPPLSPAPSPPSLFFSLGHITFSFQSSFLSLPFPDLIPYSFNLCLCSPRILPHLLLLSTLCSSQKRSVLKGQAETAIHNEVFFNVTCPGTAPLISARAAPMNFPAKGKQ